MLIVCCFEIPQDAETGSGQLNYRYFFLFMRFCVQNHPKGGFQQTVQRWKENAEYVPFVRLLEARFADPPIVNRMLKLHAGFRSMSAKDSMCMLALFL